MKRKILKKISGQSGETIAETLVALLIASLALMMLAGAVSSAMNVVTRSKKAMDDYYTVNNAVVARATAKPVKDGLTVRETTSGDYTGKLNITISGLQPSPEPIEVDYWKNEQISGTQVIAYTRPTPTPAP